MSDIHVAIQTLPHAEDLELPTYQTPQSAGMDLAAALSDGESVTLLPLKRAIIPTGLSIALPKGYEAQIRPRSGLAIKQGVTVVNAPGTIDADYRGEIKVGLINLGEDAVTITRGMRIAQMVVASHAHVIWQPSDTLDKTERGAGGFGSTGVE